jgi:hypothetical protein
MKGRQVESKKWSEFVLHGKWKVSGITRVAGSDLLFRAHGSVPQKSNIESQTVKYCKSVHPIFRSRTVTTILLVAPSNHRSVCQDRGTFVNPWPEFVAHS